MNPDFDEWQLLLGIPMIVILVTDFLLYNSMDYLHRPSLEIVPTIDFRGTDPRTSSRIKVNGWFTITNRGKNTATILKVNTKFNCTETPSELALAETKLVSPQGETRPVTHIAHLEQARLVWFSKVLEICQTREDCTYCLDNVPIEQFHVRNSAERVGKFEDPAGANPEPKLLGTIMVSIYGVHGFNRSFKVQLSWRLWVSADREHPLYIAKS